MNNSRKNTKSVYSLERTITQPKFAIHDLKIDTQQKMDGIKLLSKLENNSIPLVFFDPQYRSILDKQAYGNEGERQKGRSQLIQMDDDTIKIFLEQIYRILIPSGHLMLWVDKLIICSGINPLVSDTKFQIVDMITWNKCRMGMGYRTRRFSEYLLIFQKPPIRAKGVWKLHNIPDVWAEKIENGNRNHTHSKPIELQKQLILSVTNIGDVVVDPAAGGYSVLKAALATERHFTGCDLGG